MGKGQLIKLRLDCVGYRRVAVAKTGNGRAARPIEIAFATLVDDVATVTGDGDGALAAAAPASSQR